MSNGSLRENLHEFLKGRFTLDDDNAHQQEVEDNIRKSVEFRGQNLWILIFAIFIASVGLNVNSAAVIIGAMLISPLMGPIMGFGLSLGIYDFELLKKSLRNFTFAVVVSLATSTLYFMISPLSVAQSELLARTSPTIWDVLIAFFGGLAGIVAQTRKDRTSTVIPGVAIATALMPPLCTAGYGLGTMQLQYFVGALYLFVINAVLISIATLIIVRFLKYERKQHVDSRMERKVRNYVSIVIIITVVPSVILGYNIVTKTLFEANSKAFVTTAFNFPESQVVDYKLNTEDGKKDIEVFIIGKKLSDDAITSLNNQKEAYKLKDATLIVKQQGMEGEGSSKSIENLYNVSNKLLEEKDKKIEELTSKVHLYMHDTLDIKSIAREFAALTANKTNIALSKMAITDYEGNVVDSVLVCVVRGQDGNKTLNSDEDKTKLIDWLKARTKSSNVQLIDGFDLDPKPKK
ncbi:MAG: TIGR00341 family protein [Rikenellaceae bacterium]